MADQTERLQRQIALLRAKFVADLPDKRDLVLTLWREACARSAPQRVMDLYYLVHGLKGTAGTFGYLRLAAIMAELEDLVSAWYSTPHLAADLRLDLAIDAFRAGIGHLLADDRIRATPQAADIRTLILYDPDPERGADWYRMLRGFGFQVSLVATVAEIPELSATIRPDGLVVPEGAVIEGGRDWAERVGAPHYFGGDADGIDGLVARIEAVIHPPEVIPWRLLVIADEEPLVLAVRDAAETAGGIVHICRPSRSPAQALAAVDPDLILCDAAALSAIGSGMDGAGGIGGTVPTYAVTAVTALVHETARGRAAARQRAQTDPVTGALTGAGFIRGVAPVSGRGADLCLALVSIENLADVAVRFGDASVDILLRRVYFLLRLRLRPCPVVASLGDGTFILYQSGQTLDGLRELLDRIMVGFAHVAQIGGMKSPARLVYTAGCLAAEMLMRGQWSVIRAQLLTQSAGADEAGAPDWCV